jgi:sulfur carrier protein
MYFIFNGQIYSTFYKNITLLKLVNYFNIYQKLLIIEYNGIILTKNYWSNTLIQNFDKIEVITIVGGG